jgi:hypothetical protein
MKAHNYIKPGRYIWQNKDVDFPVNVLESLGIGSDGRVYVKIEGSNSAIPADELIKETNAEPRKKSR